MPKITLPNMGVAAVFGITAVVAAGLTFRYFGDQPLLKDAKEGLNGNVVGLFK
jgi:hypothetical protein